MNSKMLSLVFVLVTAVALAEPTITLNRVQQRYPWNGLVDVDYTVAGMDGETCDYAVSLAWTSETAGRADVAATNFYGIAGCDLPTANGSYRVTWNAAADGLDFIARDFVLTAKISYAPVSEAEADYAVIDLTAGKAATEYPVRYCKTGADYPTSHFNWNRYKTNHLVLKKVKSGHFWMGAGNVSKGTGSTRHRVFLSDDYWLGVFEVTEGQMSSVAASLISDYTTDLLPELAVERPISHISYDETIHPDKSVIALLNLRVKHGGVLQTGFNLPTEAEWEYACRAGTETAYSWGSDSCHKDDAKKDNAMVYQYAWTSGNANSLPHPVGGKLPNNWGFYDMHGNVMEWCRDWAYNYPKYSPTYISTNPVGKVWTRMKVLRGGGFHSSFGAKTSGGRHCSSSFPNAKKISYSPAPNMSAQYGYRLFKALTSDAKTTVTPEVKSSASLENLKVDFRTTTVRKILKLDEVLPFAWNSDANWPAGGAAEASAELKVMLASGDDKTDPTTWTDGGVEELEAGTGEGVTTWVPTQATLARVELTQGTTTLNGYLDLTDCQGLDKAIPIKDFSVTFGEFDVSCDGYAKTPKVTLKDGEGNELVEGVDYSVTYANNVNVGTAKVTVAGLGDYEGTIEMTFVITPRQPEIQSESSGAAKIDTRVADGEPLKPDSWRELLPVVWNDTTGWTRGGSTNELTTVRVTLEKLGENGRIVKNRTLVDFSNGEGVTSWPPVGGGEYLVVSKLYKKNKATDANWILTGTNAIRRLSITRIGTMILIR